MIPGNQLSALYKRYHFLQSLQTNDKRKTGIGQASQWPRISTYVRAKYYTTISGNDVSLLSTSLQTLKDPYKFSSNEMKMCQQQLSDYQQVLFRECGRPSSDEKTKQSDKQKHRVGRASKNKCGTGLEQVWLCPACLNPFPSSSRDLDASFVKSESMKTNDDFEDLDWVYNDLNCANCCTLVSVVDASLSSHSKTRDKNSVIKTFYLSPRELIRSKYMSPGLCKSYDSMELQLLTDLDMSFYSNAKKNTERVLKDLYQLKKDCRLGSNSSRKKVKKKRDLDDGYLTYFSNSTASTTDMFNTLDSVKTDTEQYDADIESQVQQEHHLLGALVIQKVSFLNNMDLECLVVSFLHHSCHHTDPGRLFANYVPIYACPTRTVLHRSGNVNIQTNLRKQCVRNALKPLFKDLISMSKYGFLVKRVDESKHESVAKVYLHVACCVSDSIDTLALVFGNSVISNLAAKGRTEMKSSRHFNYSDLAVSLLMDPNRFEPRRIVNLDYFYPTPFSLEKCIQFNPAKEDCYARWVKNSIFRHSKYNPLEYTRAMFRPWTKSVNLFENESCELLELLVGMILPDQSSNRPSEWETVGPFRKERDCRIAFRMLELNDDQMQELEALLDTFWYRRRTVLFQNDKRIGHDEHNAEKTHNLKLTRLKRLTNVVGSLSSAITSTSYAQAQLLYFMNQVVALVNISTSSLCGNAKGLCEIQQQIDTLLENLEIVFYGCCINQASVSKRAADENYTVLPITKLRKLNESFYRNEKCTCKYHFESLIQTFFAQVLHYQSLICGNETRTDKDTEEELNWLLPKCINYFSQHVLWSQGSPYFASLVLGGFARTTFSPMSFDKQNGLDFGVEEEYLLTTEMQVKKEKESSRLVKNGQSIFLEGLKLPVNKRPKTCFARLRDQVTVHDLIEISARLKIQNPLAKNVVLRPPIYVKVIEIIQTGPPFGSHDPESLKRLEYAFIELLSPCCHGQDDVFGKDTDHCDTIKHWDGTFVGSALLIPATLISMPVLVYKLVSQRAPAERVQPERYVLVDDVVSQTNGTVHCGMYQDAPVNGILETVKEVIFG